MQLKYFLAASAASLSLACSLAAPVHAQETTSQITGTVSSGGAPVAGASVEIRDTQTGSVSTVVTSASGGFTASSLRAGDNYTVTVVASGYEAAQVTDIITQVAQAYNLPIDLAVEGGEAIVVTASRLKGAGSVSQGPVTVLGAEQIQKIATINRDIRDLSRRDPFARLDDTPGGGRAISFAGQNARYNRFSVDGVAITDNFGLNPDGLPSRRSPIPLDAIGQFQAKVAPYDVRDGNFQGGSINIVLKSGNNEFQGSGFYAYSDDHLTGKNTKPGPGFPTGRVNVPSFFIKNYGAQLSGPIIKDKLFFMIAGERVRANTPVPEGPTDNNAGTAIPNLTQAVVDQVSAIAKNNYSYDTGGVLKNAGDKDDRLVAKLDANLSDTQQVSLTYTYAKDQINLARGISTSISTPSLGLASDGYIQGNRLHTGVARWNAQWSDEFSTEVRGFYKDYVRQQDPILGRGFGQLRVCTAPTSDRTNTGAAATASINCPTGVPVVVFGPDTSRQVNQFNSQSFGGLIQARLTRDDHDLRIFGEAQHAKLYNLFLAPSGFGVDGNYYFDSLADFSNKTAQRLQYVNGLPNLDPNDAAARFSYNSYTFGVQDNWRVSDILTVSYGARYDVYGSSDHPLYNPTFQARTGLPNNSFISGRGVFQPRFGFNFNPTSTISLRGGLGIFSGGTPDVYVSNSFSNTGVNFNTIDVVQNNSGLYQNNGSAFANQSVGSAILTNVNGDVINPAANTLLAGGTLANPAPTAALDPKFKLPSQWRATLTAEWRPEFLGGGWTFGVDGFYSSVRNQVYFQDRRIVPNGLLTPDGRRRYSPITRTTAGAVNFGDPNSDILLTNSKRGRSYVGIIRARKTFDFGVDVGASYTYQDVKDNNPASSSVATSNYGAGVSLDPNGPAYGISNDEVKHQFKYDLTFDHAFFGDYKSTIALFGETRIGRPYSYTMRDTATRSVLFGTIESGSRYLLYVPTGVSDPKVSYDNANNAALINAFIDRVGLGKYRGGIAPRNAFNSKWITKLDLHVSQELPAFITSKARFSLFADVENFTNLLNKKWGQIKEFGFPYAIAPVVATCLTAPVATGTATTGSTSANAGAPCAQYRYTPNQTAVVGGIAQFTDPTPTIYGRQSLYAIRIGARISF